LCRIIPRRALNDFKRKRVSAAAAKTSTAPIKTDSEEPEPAAPLPAEVGDFRYRRVFETGVAM